MKKKKQSYYNYSAILTSIIVGLFVLAISVIVVTQKTNKVSRADSGTDPVILAAGDIACGTGDTINASTCKQADTANLISQLLLQNPSVPTTVIPLGDLQYESGTLADFNNYYGVSWGQSAIKSITRPVIGNHEYNNATHDPSDYYNYWNGLYVGDKAKGGFYSYDLGNWHIIVVDTDCKFLNGGKGCIVGSPQELWLRSELAANTNKCLLMVSHHPYFSSLRSSVPLPMYPLVKDFYDAHGDLLLTGHVHNYERFSPQQPLYTTSTTAPTGASDPNGITEIIVGTGGRNHAAVTQQALNSVAFDKADFGVLKLALHPASYDYAFVATSGTTIDSGTGSCHNVVAISTPITTGSTSPTPTPVVSPSLTPIPATIALNAVADTWVESDKPTTHFGNNTAIYVNGSGPAAIGYLKFDLSSLTDMTIKSAKLRIEVAKDTSSLSQNVKQVDNTTWSESTLTYNTKPALTNILGTISSGGKSLTWQEIDVTPYIQSKIGTLVSLGIDMTGTNSIHFYSKESGIAPQLVITTQ